MVIHGRCAILQSGDETDDEGFRAVLDMRRVLADFWEDLQAEGGLLLMNGEIIEAVLGLSEFRAMEGAGYRHKAARLAP
jgi:hypothetical protein